MFPSDNSDVAEYLRHVINTFAQRDDIKGRVPHALPTDTVLRVDGCVSDVYAPHVLDNPDGHYSKYMKFHAFDDVLVLYYPPFPNGFVRIQRVCTHAELHDGTR